MQKDLISLDSLIVRQLDLPIGVNGITFLDENGDYNIYLNSRYSHDAQTKAFRHEIAHIIQGHFSLEEDIQLLEEQAKTDANKPIQESHKFKPYSYFFNPHNV